MHHISSFLISAFVCLFLFIFMDIMITTEAEKVMKEEFKPRQIFVSATKKDSFKKKQYEIKKIKELPIKELFPSRLVSQTMMPKINIHTPNLSSFESKMKLQMLTIKKPSMKETQSVTSSTPIAKNLKNEEVIFKEPVYENIDSVTAIKKVEPHYPRRAKKKGIGGFVTLSFKINPNGTVFDAVVTSSNPKNIFDKAALQALKQWRFNSFEKALKYKTSSATFNFRID